LIHISEISEKRIEHPKEVLKEGDTCTLRIIKIDNENHRIGLSYAAWIRWPTQTWTGKALKEFSETMMKKILRKQTLTLDLLIVTMKRAAKQRAFSIHCFRQKPHFSCYNYPGG
jgi:transcriptional accessory protein Tex/SPT6